MALGKYNPLKADSPEIVKTRFTKVEATNPLCPENLDLGFVCEENMKLLYKRICIYSLFFFYPPLFFLDRFYMTAECLSTRGRNFQFGWNT